MNQIQLKEISRKFFDLIRYFLSNFKGIILNSFIAVSKAVKNNFLVLSVIFVIIYSLLGALSAYCYEPYKFYNSGFPSFLVYFILSIAGFLRWGLQVVVVYFLLKIFKYKVKFRSLLVTLGFCIVPLIIYYILDLILTYNIVHPFHYILGYGYYVIIYFALARVYKISGWKTIFILLILFILFEPAQIFG